MGIKFLAAFAPTCDEKDRFFSTTPTSLGWALAPTVDNIDNKKIIGVSYVDKIFDPRSVKENTWSQFEEIVSKEKPDVLLLSSTYDSHNSAKKLAQLFKSLNNQGVVVYGGPHVNEVTLDQVVSSMPTVYPLNEQNNPFDILVQGQGDLVIQQILLDISREHKNITNYLQDSDTIKKYSSIPGAATLHIIDSANNVQKKIYTGMTSLELNRLPPMPRHLFGNDMDLYGFSCFYEENTTGKKQLLPSVSTLLHRGCKGRCLYCSERGGFDTRSNEDIIFELDLLKSKGIRGVFFDDSTLSDHENWPNMLRILKEKGLQYGSLNRFDKLADKEYVVKLRDAGFVYQYCSIEQLDDTVLKKAGKRQGIEDITRGVSNLKEEGISLGISLLFGLPNETPTTIQRTLDYTAKLVDEGAVSCVSMSLYSFHPGTPLTLIQKPNIRDKIRFDCDAPNPGYPWNQFEEGRWYHLPQLTEEKVLNIAEEANRLFHSKLVRNMRKDYTVV